MMDNNPSCYLSEDEWDELEDIREQDYLDGYADDMDEPLTLEERISQLEAELEGYKEFLHNCQNRCEQAEEQLQQAQSEIERLQTEIKRLEGEITFCEG